LRKIVRVDSAVISISNGVIMQGKVLVLSNVNFDVQAGEFVYLVGKTGSGKSSLLKTLYAELPLPEGQLSVCGYSLGNLTPKQVPFLRRKLGIIFQDFQLLTDRSVSDNFMFVLEATGWTNKYEMEQRIDEVLTSVDLKTKGFKFPHELSGGEQQRVVIARSLLNHPELIIADEPTANLDPDTSLEIIRVLYQISRKGTAVLISTHDKFIVEQFPGRFLKCEKSTIMESQTAFS
jgi:cell division transport system ATP-binding protein